MQPHASLAHTTANELDHVSDNAHLGPFPILRVRPPGRAIGETACVSRNPM